MKSEIAGENTVGATLDMLAYERHLTLALIPNRNDPNGVICRNHPDLKVLEQQVGVVLERELVLIARLIHMVHDLGLPADAPLPAMSAEFNPQANTTHHEEINNDEHRSND
jgi:hypothetical protein